VEGRPEVMVALAEGLALLRALLAAAEAAISRVNLSRARELAQSGPAGRAVLSLKVDRELRLGVGSVVSEALLLGCALCAAFAPEEQTHHRALVSAATGLGAAGLAVLLELVLRSFAQARPEAWAIRLARPLFLIARAVRPVWELFTRLIGRLTGPLGGQRPQRAEPMPSLEDLEAHLSAQAARGQTGPTDPLLLRSLLEFSEKTAREVMVPRTRVVGLEINAPTSEIVRLVSEEGHTRLPVYRETLDDLLGFLHSRDLVPLLANPELIVLQDLVRAPFFVPWAKRIGAVLREMQRRSCHIAAVVDEYGGVMGVITVEDILAEIVGEFGDETAAGDSEEGPEIERLVDGSALVKASLGRADFAKAFGVELSGNEAETLGGWLNAKHGAIPEIGERFYLGGFVLTVFDRSPSRVKRIRVSRPRGSVVVPLGAGGAGPLASGARRR
jgi:CBS domain containing-hemolysin-like protein